MKLNQVLQALGITMELGKNFDEIVRGPNVWPRIIDRETAIKAIQYGCKKGPALYRREDHPQIVEGRAER